MSKTVRYNPDTNSRSAERRHLKRKLKQQRVVKTKKKQDERDSQ